MKLYDKSSHLKICQNCFHARIPDDKSLCLCTKNGVVEFDFSCKKYKYDPLKRVPNKQRISGEFTKECFDID